MAVIMWRGKQRWKNQLIVGGIIVMGIYLLIFRGHKVQEDDVTELVDDELDEDEIAEELESKKKVESVTFMAPRDEMFAWSANLEGKAGENKSNSDFARALKYHQIWSYAHSVTSVHQLWANTPDVDTVLSALQTARIVYVDILDPEEFESGTSEKWVIVLEGGQKAMMKLVWEPKLKGSMKRKGKCNIGYEMPWAEVAAFHLHRLLGFRNTPFATGRVVDIKKEILPVASPAVTRQLIRRGSKLCVRGKCYHCERDTILCPENGIVETSIVYWVHQKLHQWTKHPLYMPYSTPRQDDWGKYGFNDKTYCNKIRSEPPYDTLRYFHDLFDFAVIDTLMYHYDSKHYIVEDKTSKASGLTVRLDHGRAFCAHDEDKVDVFLTPINQCCIMRRETYWSLKSLQPGILTDRLKGSLRKDPMAPVLLDVWYETLERRLKVIVDLADKCAKAVGGLENMIVG